MSGETGDSNKLAAVVFDWAGTVIDFGSQAPMGAFVELFTSEGVTISIDEARVPMGLPKWQHIEALTQLPRVAAAWAAHHGSPGTREDIDRLHEKFTPMNLAAVPRHAGLIEGVVDVIAALRARGLRIGSTTGYNREIMAVLAPLAAEQGFMPDNLVCAGDVPQNRPAPHGMYRCFLDLDVWPARRVVKVDDTVPGLMEGRHAGCWTVGVTVSGNETGLTRNQWEALDSTDRAARRERAAQRLNQAKPDYLVETVGGLLPVIEAIERRLANGESPPA
ncbi:MAG: phosphonoacetaldehyde hydrolase [Betaproteobacteria bacterium]|nr:phosphonoacetaldehyde hydrolase [Betaproteobacteria bacterium]